MADWLIGMPAGKLNYTYVCDADCPWPRTVLLYCFDHKFGLKEINVALKLASSFKWLGCYAIEFCARLIPKMPTKILKAFLPTMTAVVLTEYVPANYILEINETYHCDSSCGEALNNTSIRKTSLKRHHWYVFTFSWFSAHRKRYAPKIIWPILGMGHFAVFYFFRFFNVDFNSLKQLR